MLAYLFPGQGAQTRGMGAEIFSEFPELVTQADEILQYSVKKLCLDDPDGQLNLTQYTQPALYVVNALMYYKKIRETSRKPDYVCGHSLGEYNALLAANVFDFSTGLKLVKRRGELMSEAKDGGMAAIIGLGITDVERILRENGLVNITIANHNSYSQFVISGAGQDINNAETVFRQQQNVNFIPLKVSGAFHSAHMSGAQQKFASYLAQFDFSTPIIPVLSNIDAMPYHPAITSSHLAKQITHPVKWTRIIENLLKNHDIELIECGPGAILTGLLRRIKNKQ
jgi:malonyl CoA-acyl carrier protein transacylase